MKVTGYGNDSFALPISILRYSLAVSFFFKGRNLWLRAVKKNIFVGELILTSLIQTAANLSSGKMHSETLRYTSKQSLLQQSTPTESKSFTNKIDFIEIQMRNRMTFVSQNCQSFFQ